MQDRWGNQIERFVTLYDPEVLQQTSSSQDKYNII